jgi:hypothetical protein
LYFIAALWAVVPMTSFLFPRLAYPISTVLLTGCVGVFNGLAIYSIPYMLLGLLVDEESTLKKIVNLFL